jgi:hypothetical protein
MLRLPHHLDHLELPENLLPRYPKLQLCQPVPHTPMVPKPNGNLDSELGARLTHGFGGPHAPL